MEQPKKEQTQKEKTSFPDKVKAFINNRKFQSAALALLLIVFIGGYTLFFTSPFYMPTDTSTFKLSAINKAEKLDEHHEFTLLRWDYSPEQQLMELELDVTNTAFDGNNTYQYGVQTQPAARAKVETIIEEPSYIVVQITNIPKDFEQVSFRISLPDGNGGMLRLYNNTAAINRVESIQTLSKNDYLKNRLVRNIDVCKDKISELTAAMSDNDTKISNIKAQNKSLEADKKYMTETEAAQVDQRILSNKSLIEQREQENEKLKIEILEQENKIKLAQQQLDEMD